MMNDARALSVAGESGVLTGRVAFVTGGGRGIGRAIVLRFAGAGARIVVAARSTGEVQAVAAEVERAGGQALPVHCDVTSAASVQASVEETLRRFGSVDVLVNNAGVAESAPFTRLDRKLWDRTLAVNLTGTYLCMREVLGSMIERRWGRIINIASTAAQEGYAYTAAYCAAKHGVLGLTRAVALEVERQGITVNAICPGWVDTEMTAASIARIVKATGRTPEAARAELEGMNPQGRLIRPEEVAALAFWLAGGEASSVTGQAYNVDDGRE